MWQGVPAAVEHQSSAIPRDIATVIDVGANRGQFALFMRAHAPDASIICLEPLSQPLRDLRRLFTADSKVHIQPHAASSAAGSATMHVSARDDSSSLFPITDVQTLHFPGTQETRRESVSRVRLDDLIDKQSLAQPILLKLDVQGSELAALEGAVRLLQVCDYVLVECSFVEFYQGQPLFADVYHFLDACNFRFSGATCSAHDAAGAWLQADVLFRSVR